MTKEETKKAIEVMQHYLNGGEIEVRNVESDNKWVTCVVPIWDWCGCNYRIKPETKYRPYANMQEVLKDKKIHGDMMVLKSRTEAISIHYIADAYMVIVGTICKTIPYDEALKDFTWEDGSPFGVKEE